MRNKLRSPRLPAIVSPLGRAVHAMLGARRCRFAYLTAGLTSLASPVFADAFPPVLDLATLDGTNGFAINGVDSNPNFGGELSGFAVGAAGDVNGDGNDDLVIGAPGANFPDPRTTLGASYVVFGSPSLGGTGSVELSELDGDGVLIVGEVEPTDTPQYSAFHHNFGFDVAAGDFNGDGFDDVASITTDADRYGGYAGRTWVVFGAEDLPSRIANWEIDGANGFVDVLSPGYGSDVRSISPAGDVNGDGFDDVVIGMPSEYGSPELGNGLSYVLFGDPAIGQNTRRRLSFAGLGAADGAGTAVAGGGDVNGDGFSDVVITATGPAGYDEIGVAYVVFGNAAIDENDAFDFASLDGSNGFVLRGAPDYASAGIADVNGDGFSDVLIGAKNVTPGDSHPAGVFVVLGSDEGFPAAIDLSSLESGSRGFVIAGAEAVHAVGTAGDLNDDGIEDVVIGGVGGRFPPHDAPPGISYVVFGAPDLGATGRVELSSLDGTNGFALAGVADGDDAGFSAGAAGDINADGIDDLLIGAPRAGQPAGTTYVVFGKSATAPGCTVSATPSILTPADHRLVDVVTTVNVMNGTGFELLSLKSSEPGMGLPGGDIKWDMQLWERGAPDTQGRLRAEVDPRGSGRTYTFTYRTTGGSGDAGTCRTTVTVPNSQGLHVTIDIAPSDRNNVIRPTTDPIVRVAVLSSTSLPFDPADVNPDSLRFGPRNAHSQYEFVRDVNGDGIGDLVATFAMAETGIACGAIRATLVAQTTSGLRIYDSDRIETSGCP